MILFISTAIEKKLRSRSLFPNNASLPYQNPPPPLPPRYTNKSTRMRPRSLQWEEVSLAPDCKLRSQTEQRLCM